VRSSRNPWFVLIVGLFGLGLFGWAGYQLFVVGAPRYAARDLTNVRGRLHQSRVLRQPRGIDVLQLWVEGQRLPFRTSSIIYPRCYRNETLAALQPGADIEIGVLPSERIKPYRSRISGQEFLNIYSLAINGAVALSVDDYNRCAEHNDKVGRIVDPIMLAISVALVVFSVRAIVQQRRSKTKAANG
jgi:hypothetical protein